MHLANGIPDMRIGDHAAIVPEYIQHLKRLFLEAHALEIINVERLNLVPAKQIYEDFTSSFPPPKVIYKYENLPLIFLIPVAVCQPEPELLENLRHCISYWILKTVAVCQSENNHGTCGCMPRLVKVNLKLIIFCKFH